MSPRESAGASWMRKRAAGRTRCGIPHEGERGDVDAGYSLPRSLARSRQAPRPARSPYPRNSGKLAARSGRSCGRGSGSPRTRGRPDSAFRCSHAIRPTEDGAPSAIRVVSSTVSGPSLCQRDCPFAGPGVGIPVAGRERFRGPANPGVRWSRRRPAGPPIRWREGTEASASKDCHLPRRTETLTHPQRGRSPSESINVRIQERARSAARAAAAPRSPA